MLDLRVYRAAFIPAVLALFIVAFSLENRPAPLSAALAPDAFDVNRAFGAPANPARNSLLELAAAFPDRAPGSADDAGLADRVQESLTAAGFRVSRRTDPVDARNGRQELATVTGVRAGLSSRRVIVLAHRDTAHPPATAELSATAALIELARISRAREMQRTLVVVSTSGGSLGGAGARAWARELKDPGNVDAVIVLGDLASRASRRPWVVPWSNGGAPAPIALRRTLETALRAEVASEPGASRAAAQWARRAAPLTVSEQGEVLAAGLPAVLVQVSGERGPEAGAPVTSEGFADFGRGVLRAVTAIDQSRLRRRAVAEAAAFEPATDGIVTLRKVLPTWSVRLFVGTLLLPAVLAAVDGFFRVRRRGGHAGAWVSWTLAGAVPLMLAWGWARLLDVVGLFDAPPSPPPQGVIPLDAAGIVAAASAVLVAVLAWVFLRPRLVGSRDAVDAGAQRSTGARRLAAEAPAAAATGLVLASLAIGVWIANPYAAALLVPAVHAWLFALSPESRSRVAGAVLVLAGLSGPLFVVLYYGVALRMSPVDLTWLGYLSAAGGVIGPLSALAISVFGGCLAGVLLVRRARRRLAPRGGAAPLVTRGPSGYAGPGSLGGTKSALRR